MKKIIVFLLALCLVFAFVGCGGTETGDGEGKLRVSIILGKLGGAGIDDASYAGYEKAVNELPIEGRYIEQGRDPSKFRALVLEACENSDVVISTAGNGMIDEMIEAAEEFPEVMFMVLDTPIVQDNIADLPNFMGMMCSQSEVSYLCGYLGMRMSKTGKIGVVVGVEYPVLCDFITGYIDGAQAANPDAQVAVSASGDWDDQAAAKETALAQILLGVDTVYCVGSNSSFGSLEACKEQGVWGIGCDTDMAAQFIGIDDEQADVVITSAYKDWGAATYDFIRRVVEDPNLIPWGTVEIAGLHNGGIKLIKNEIYEKQVPADIKAEIEELEQKIINGDVKPRSYFANMTHDDYTDLKEAVRITG